MEYGRGASWGILRGETCQFWWLPKILSSSLCSLLKSSLCSQCCGKEILCIRAPSFVNNQIVWLCSWPMMTLDWHMIKSYCAICTNVFDNLILTRLWFNSFYVNLTWTFYHMLSLFFSFFAILLVFLAQSWPF